MSNMTETRVQTSDLTEGMCVVVPGGHVRTVSAIVTSPYVNKRGEVIVNVMYAEGRTAEWGAGNSAISTSTWRVI